MRRKGFRDSLVVLGLSFAAGVAARVHGQEPELVDQVVEVVEDVALRDATTRVFRKLSWSEVADAATGSRTSVACERAFIQKGSGLCYLDSDGQWTPAAPRWTASGGSFRVAEAAYELASGLLAGGGVEFFLEGSTLRATPQGIVFTNADAEAPGCRFDGAANAAIGAEVARKLRFPEAYGREVDLEYEVSPAGFEQNLHLRTLPLLPGGFEAGSTSVVVRTRVNVPELTASGLFVAVNGEPADLDATGGTDWVQIGQISFDGPEGPLFWFADSLVVRGDGASTIAEKRFHFDSTAGEWLLEERVPFEFFNPSGAFPVLWDFTVRSGAITTADVWGSGETIFVVNDITVQAPGVLTIEPDCVVKINFDDEIVVATGKVIAKGAPYRPITFTSADDPDCGERLCIPPPENPCDPENRTCLNPCPSCVPPIPSCNPNVIFGKPSRCLVINPGSDPNWEIDYCRFNKCLNTNLVITASSARSSPTSLRNCVFRTDAAYVKAVEIIASGPSSHTVKIENNLFDSDQVTPQQGTCVSMTLGAPLPTYHNFIVRNNTFLDWYSGLYVVYAYGCTVKQNLFSNVALPGSVTVAYEVWAKNGYWASSIPASDTSPIGLYASPFDATTAPTLGFFYLNNSAGGGALLRYQGADLAKDVFPGEFRQFKFKAPTPLMSGSIIFDTQVVVEPDYDYPTGNENVSIGFHAPRVDRLHDHNLKLEGAASSLELKPDTVLALDSSRAASPYIWLEASTTATIGGELATDPWVTVLDARAASTIADVRALDQSLCYGCFTTPQYQINGRVEQIRIRSTNPLGSGLARVSRTRFLWMGDDSSESGNVAALSFREGTPSPGSYVRDLEFLNCEGALFHDISPSQIPITNCLFYRCGTAVLPAVLVGNGSPVLNVCTFDGCVTGISKFASAVSFQGVTVRNSIFSECSTGIKLPKESLTEDHNAFAAVTSPIVWTVGAGTEAGSINRRSYQLGSLLPYDRVAGSERSLWFLKGRHSQVPLTASDISLEDGGAGLASDYGVDLLSTSRRAVRDRGPVDLGYHVRDFADGDADGMPTVWEQHFGLNPSLAADAALDPDLDLLTSLTEFQRGTWPTSADADGDLRTGLGKDGEEAFVWQYDWSSDAALAQNVVDPLRRNGFFFGGNLSDFKGISTQRGGPVQTLFGPTSATFTWETGTPASLARLWVRRHDAFTYTAHGNSSGTVHTVTVTDLDPATLYFVRAESKDAQTSKLQIARPLPFYTDFEASVSAFKTAPYLQNPVILSATQSQVAVLWRTTTSTTGNKVYLRAAGSSTEDLVPQDPPDSGTAHKVRLLSLSPGTRYFYRVAYGQPPSEVSSAVYSFRALPYHDPASPGKVVVAVHGDNRAEGVNEFSFAHTRVAETILSLPEAPELDFAVSLGEVYNKGLDPAAEPWFPHLLSPARDLLASVPLFVAVGDTEYNSDSSLATFRGLFELPAHNVAAQANHSFYSFNYGRCHFIVLDTGGTNISPLGHEGAAGADTQHEWLIQDLQAAVTQVPRPWICVFLHKAGVTDTFGHPWDEQQTIDVRRGTATTLETFGVDMVFQAGSHTYERFQYSVTDPAATSDVHRDFGVHYVVSGGAGALPHRVLLADPTPGVAGRRRGLSTYNACVLTANGDTSLEVKAYELSGPGPLDVLTLSHKWPHPKRALADKFAVPASDSYKWKYFQSGNPGADWNTLDFVDTSWPVATFNPDPGLREFGFGDGDEGVVLASGQTDYYFRRRFPLVAGDIAAGDVVELRLVVDDGCEVYLHGGNLPSPVQVASVALSDMFGPEERRWRFVRVTALDPRRPPETTFSRPR